MVLLFRLLFLYSSSLHLFMRAPFYVVTAYFYLFLDLILDAMQLQHIYRMVWNSHTLVLHRLHHALFEDLLALSVSAYPKVRQRAQSFLIGAVHKIPQARATI